MYGLLGSLVAGLCLGKITRQGFASPNDTTH